MRNILSDERKTLNSNISHLWNAAVVVSVLKVFCLKGNVVEGGEMTVRCVLLWLQGVYTVERWWSGTPVTLMTLCWFKLGCQQTATESLFMR